MNYHEIVVCEERVVLVLVQKLLHVVEDVLACVYGESVVCTQYALCRSLFS